jgi:hypothetical protein
MEICGARQFNFDRLVIIKSIIIHDETVENNEEGAPMTSTLIHKAEIEDEILKL